jgi:hypothetical protein
MPPIVSPVLWDFNGLQAVFCPPRFFRPKPEIWLSPINNRDVGANFAQNLWAHRHEGYAV